MARIDSIEGIGSVNASKLAAAGITRTEQLLQRGAQPAGRKELAAETGIGETRLLAWINRADLFRIKGVGEQYSDLLEAAGVDTVPELAQRNSLNLVARMEEVNAKKRLVRRTPAARAVAGWIAQAKALPRVVHY